MALPVLLPAMFALHDRREEHQQYLGDDRGYSTCFIAENSNEEDDTANDIYYMETEEEGEEDENRNIFEILDDEISEDDE